MAIIVFFSAFITSIFYFFVKLRRIKTGIYTSLRLSFVYGFLTLACISYVFCEVFSVFNCLDLTHLTLGWGFIFLAFLGLVWRLNIHKEKSLPFLPKVYNAYLILIWVGILLPILVFALVIPPNNWDSMTYHMTRVEQWRQNLNVYPFPTSNIRQVNFPPLAEYIILNFQILSQSDYFANLVQFFSLLGSISLISLLGKLFELDFKGQFFAVLLLVSIPMVIFQASSTQTDLTASFFLLGVVYSVFKTLQTGQSTLQDKFILGLFLVLGGLIKYTVFVFSGPFLVLVAYPLLKNRSWKEIYQYAIIVGGLLIFVFGPFIYRNLAYFGNLTGETGLVSMMGNEHPDVFKMIGNAAKNVADEFTIPLNSFNRILNNWVNNIHAFLGMPVDSAETNYFSIPYQTSFIFAEDNASSFLHSLLILVSLFILISRLFTQKVILFKRQIILFLGCLLISFFTYSFLFKWQPWGNRLLLPLFILAVSFVSIVLYQRIKKYTFCLHALIVLLMLYSLPTVFFNRNKPVLDFYQMRVILKKPKGLIIKSEFLSQSKSVQKELLTYYFLKEDVFIINQGLTREMNAKLFQLQDSLRFFENEKISIFNKSREENYFIVQPFLYPIYVANFNQIPLSKNRISLHITSDSYEYPLWVFAHKKFGNNFSMGHPAYNFKIKARNQFLAKTNDIHIYENKNFWVIE